MKLVIVGIVAFFVSGCATLSPAGEAVRVTSNPDVVRGCKWLGNVKGQERLIGGVFQGSAEESAMARVRNRAAALGANVVLLGPVSTNYSGSGVRGEAYSCR